jgi:serine/threonine protein phosphatase PrpC
VKTIQLFKVIIKQEVVYVDHIGDSCILLMCTYTNTHTYSVVHEFQQKIKSIQIHLMELRQM